MIKQLYGLSFRPLSVTQLLISSIPDIILGHAGRDINKKLYSTLSYAAGPGFSLNEDDEDRFSKYLTGFTNLAMQLLC